MSKIWAIMCLVSFMSWYLYSKGSYPYQVFTYLYKIFDLNILIYYCVAFLCNSLLSLYPSLLEKSRCLQNSDTGLCCVLVKSSQPEGKEKFCKEIEYLRTQCWILTRKVHQYPKENFVKWRKFTRGLNFVQLYCGNMIWLSRSFKKFWKWWIYCTVINKMFLIWFLT